RAGAGLITVATPRAAASRISAAVPEAMTVPLPDDVDGIVAGVLEAAEKAHVLAIGPGLGLAEATQQAVRRLVTEADRTVVLDADGINAFRDHTELLEAPDGRPEDRQLVLTPQAKELGRLAGSSGHGVHARRTETAVEQARRFGATLVAKGPRSVIAAADGRVWINGTGGPALASGGTGDVLTGITAAMMAQHRDPASVAAAVHVHGLAGDLAAEHLSARATGASDVADHVAAAALELGI
ncbi:MAG: NAD(P)H-hydrate dehydratase, partial [Actinomycetota bacterium]